MVNNIHMSANLPPLAALRSFVALVKTGSVNAAAEELHVTHGAVSHQIKSLEDNLGILLVDRRSRQLSLTDDGRMYAYRIRQALDDISQATEQVKLKRDQNCLALSVLPSFAMYWLVPRLSDFSSKHPEINLQINGTMTVVNFDQQNIDCAIRFGHGEWPFMHCEKLMADTLLMVCAPVLKHTFQLETMKDVLKQPLLHAGENWSAWLSATGQQLNRAKAYIQFSDSTHLIEAVRLGMGVALTRRSLVGDLIARGELVKAMPTEVVHSSSYYFVYPHRVANLHRVSVFKTWLQDQIKKYTL